MSMNEVNKFLYKILKEHKKGVSVIIIIAVIGAILTVIIPYIYGKLFDLAIVENSPLILLLSLIGIWLLLSLISNYITNKTGFLGEVLGSRISLGIEADLYSHFLTLPILFHKTEQKGEILQKISRGAWTLQSLIETVSDVLPQFLMLVFSFIAMSIIQWQLAMIILISFIIYSVLTIGMMKPIMKLYEKENRLFEKQYGGVYDKLYNVFVVKNFVMEENEKKNFFNSLVNKLIPMVKQTSRRSTKLSIIQDIIYSVSFVVVLGSAIFFLRSHDITPGEFVMFFGYINLAFGPFRFLSRIYRTFKRSSSAVKRFLKIKKMIPEEMKHGNKIISDVKGEIIFRNVSFGYSRKREVLKKINLKIDAGKSVALVGKSGVGKTTLSELILGYYKPKTGEILLDGVDISKLKLKWFRDKIAIVPQEISLFNDTLINNLKYSNPKASEEEIIRAAKAAYAHDFIKDLPKRYKTKVGEKGFKLSTGQKQRIALTMAFLKNPKILILDEPTASLDAKSEKLVQQGIKNLIEGRTTIIIAHRFSTVRGADEIIVLEKGRVAEEGSHEQLMKKRGLYYELYTLQKGLD
jgi:ABC-type multidrug transport system fused ATPase/permease subunit